MYSIGIPSSKLSPRGLTHREPLIDEAHFDRFVETCAPLLRSGRDVMCILYGRTESSVGKVRHVLREFALMCESFFCYITKQVRQYGYWKRQRGIAKYKNLEHVFMTYKGALPKHVPKERVHVDPGSL